MNKMISTLSGFQYSVNIAYDLYHDDKCKDFIPTKSSMAFLKDVLYSTRSNSTDRARVLVGPYGKGKSHTVLMALSILMKRDKDIIQDFILKAEDDTILMDLINDYYDSESKILPVIISGTHTSLYQSFLLSLQKTLSENNLNIIMPETNFEAAVRTIDKWRKDFPDVYLSFTQKISVPVKIFVAELKNYNVSTYEEFNKLYPFLTAGSIFNPFQGFDIVEIYEAVIKALKPYGYSGVYVVYDEFSKYLESEISSNTISDTKMLQDFAERCNRSGNDQMHLLLISHKEFVSYIGDLPKHKIDGLRGVSERFKTVHLNNNFAQTYEIIGSVIQREPTKWDAFLKRNKGKFIDLSNRYSKHTMFRDVTSEELFSLIYRCYPLHPLTTFILPRLSEKIAQNERTLFTFLSGNGLFTLPDFLTKHNQDKFYLITPDLLYDYFEPLFRKEFRSGELHKDYVLTSSILESIYDRELECKIIKTIFLIYLLESFELLKPTLEELLGTFCVDYTSEQITSAVDSLVRDDYVIYLKRSNNFLKLKSSSGIDLADQIADAVTKKRGSFSSKALLNKINRDRYVYPVRYNDDHEIVRYFEIEFINAKEVFNDVNWQIKSQKMSSDGKIYAIIPSEEESINTIKESLLLSSMGSKRCLFVVPKQYKEIESILEEYSAVETLKRNSQNDTALFDEYDVISEDLRQVIDRYIASYIRPEELESTYIFDGQIKNIYRKADLTSLLSAICCEIYPLTPVINNEAINKNEISTFAQKSRLKVLEGLLKKELEPKLGLVGHGQDVSIMRSTLIQTDILITERGCTRINLEPRDPNMKNVLNEIKNFVIQAKDEGEANFQKLYDVLTLADYQIGLRMGPIPIYIAAILNGLLKDIVIKENAGLLPLNANTLTMINANPINYSLVYVDWNLEKSNYIQSLADMFSQYIIESEKTTSPYDYVALAMQRWYLSLPRYSKDTKSCLNGDTPDKRYFVIIRLFKQSENGYELLFEKIPNALDVSGDLSDVTTIINHTKEYFDSALLRLENELINGTKQSFCMSSNKNQLDRMSLSSVVKDWCETLDEQVFEQLFPNGAEKLLQLFQNVHNNEKKLVADLARTLTGLRIEDWDDKTKDKFLQILKEYKNTAESFMGTKEIEESSLTSTYELTFRDNDGKRITRRFDHIQRSKKGKLLYNSIKVELDSMGYSISQQEKRQILMEVIKELC